MEETEKSHDAFLQGAQQELRKEMATLQKKILMDTVRGEGRVKPDRWTDGSSYAWRAVNSCTLASIHALLPSVKHELLRQLFKSVVSQQLCSILLTVSKLIDQLSVCFWTADCRNQPQWDGK